MRSYFGARSSLQLRPQLASVMTATLAGMIRGDEYASSLERGRSKLLYAVPPRKFGLRTELAATPPLRGRAADHERPD